jgi:hypothetical protein
LRRRVRARAGWRGRAGVLGWLGARARCRVSRLGGRAVDRTSGIAGVREKRGRREIREMRGERMAATGRARGGRVGWKPAGARG